MNWFTWRDWISALSLLFGAVSLYWAKKQSQVAVSAQSAEREVRRELHRQQVIQKMSQLSVSLLKVHTLSRGGQFEFAMQAAWELSSDFSHVLGFCRTELSADEHRDLTKLSNDCGQVVGILPGAPQQTISAKDLRSITNTCTNALTHIRRLQGRLEGQSSIADSF